MRQRHERGLGRARVRSTHVREDQFSPAADMYTAIGHVEAYMSMHYFYYEMYKPLK